MAIIIPSDKIYDKQNNNKVKDNYIERVEVQAYDGEVTTASQQCNESQTLEFTAESDSIQADDNGVVEYLSLNTTIPRLLTIAFLPDLHPETEMFARITKLDTCNKYQVAFSAISPRYVTIPKFSIPARVDKNSYIRQSDMAKGKRGITYTIFGNKIKGKNNVRVRFIDENNAEYISCNNVTNSTITKDVEIVPEMSVYEASVDFNPIVYSNLELLRRDTITGGIPITASDEYLVFPEFQVLAGCYYVLAMNVVDDDELGLYYEEGGFPISSLYVFYEPKRVEIKYYGKVYTLNLEEQTLNYPVTNATSRTVFSVDNNELMQTETVLRSVKSVKQYEFEYLNSAINPSGAWQPTTQYLQNGTVYVTFTFAGYKNEELSSIQDCRGEIRAEVAVHRDYIDDNGVQHSYTEYYDFGVPYYKGDRTVSKSVYVGTFGNPYLVFQWDYMSYLSGVQEYKLTAIRTLPTSTCFVDTEKSEAYSQALANDILTAYKNGKETATILCSIANYYDEKGNLVISKNSSRMSFHLYDEVIPYVYRGEYADDRPLSYYEDGSPKRFIVLGTKIYYDGAVWQELTLQEA